MVAPVVAGAMIGAGASLVGGMLGQKSQQRQQRAALDAQREFAQHGIQWRVEDAKAAGLHPLFALGASTSGPTIPVMEDPFARGLAEAGQGIGRAVAAQQTDPQRAAEATALRVAESQIARNYAEAMAFESQAARNRQAGNSSPPMPPADPNIMADPQAATRGPSAANLVSVEPSKSTSYSGSDPSMAAAKDVMWKTFKVGGRDWILPNADSVSEALESVSESLPLMWIVIRENMKRNPNFIAENAHIFPYGDSIASARHALTDPDTYRKLLGLAPVHQTQNPPPQPPIPFGRRPRINRERAIQR